MMGAAYTTPALDAGEYPYFCMVHPWMEGLVIVTDEGKKQSGSHPGVEEPIAFSTVAFMLCSANALGAA